MLGVNSITGPLHASRATHKVADAYSVMMDALVSALRSFVRYTES